MPGRVRTRRRFAAFNTPTGRGRSGPLRITFVAVDDPSVNVAYAISRKVGNAVVRNTIRRRLRALFAELTPQPHPGDYLVRCGFETGELSYAELRIHLNTALERAGAR